MIGSFTSRVKQIWTGDGKAPSADTTTAKPAAVAEEAKPGATEKPTAELDSLLSRSIHKGEKDAETLKDEADLKSVEERVFARGTMDLEDYRTQLSKSTKVASKAKLLKYIPGTSQYAEALKGIEGEMESIKQEIAILDAMTAEERKKPELLLQHGFKRKQRIAATTNSTVAEINKSLERFEFMRELFGVMAKLKKEGKTVPEDPKELTKWAKENPEVLKRLKKYAPSGMGAGAALKGTSRFFKPEASK